MSEQQESSNRDRPVIEVLRYNTQIIMASIGIVHIKIIVAITFLNVSTKIIIIMKRTIYNVMHDSQLNFWLLGCRSVQNFLQIFSKFTSSRFI